MPVPSASMDVDEGKGSAPESGAMDVERPARSGKAEVRSGKAEVRSGKAEVRSGKAEAKSGSLDAKDNENLMWVEKYRPKRLEDMVAQDDKLSTISRLIDAGKLPHLLLYGPPGTGKTSTILACARRLNGDNFKSRVLELNASDDRGIGVVQNQIKSFASSKQLFQKGIKLIILDECDSMTRDAQFALRRVIEKFTNNTRFCLICNYINKITPALQSRCMRFRFGPLERDQVTARVQEIANTERVDLRPDGLKAIVDLAEGDMRKCLNVMQAVHLAYRRVDEENVYMSTGNPTPKTINGVLRTLLNENYERAYAYTEKQMRINGYALADMVRFLHERVATLKMPAKGLIFVLDKLSNIEHNLSAGARSETQLGALVGCFNIAKNLASGAMQVA